MSNNKLSLLLASAYVLLGTLYAFYFMHEGASEGILYYFFIPVSALPQIIILVEKDPFGYILICQVPTTFVVAFLIRSLLPIIMKKE